MMKHIFVRVLRKEMVVVFFSGFVQLNLSLRGTVVLQRRGAVHLK